MNDFDTSNFDLETASNGRNKLMLDDLGDPSVMVAVPAFKISDIVEGGSDEWHPAFIIGGNLAPVIWVSKYQNVVVNDRAYSLAGKTPRTSINFDTALQVCRNKGDGWHLMTNAEWAAVALWSRKNGTQPYGNNSYGKDVEKPWLHGIAAIYGTDGKINQIKTGSMGAVSSHDGTDSGIMDLNGNEWERCSAFRLNNGEINIIPDNNAAMPNCDMSVNSSTWRAILPNGTLVDPGTDGTLKFKSSVVSTDSGETGNFDFESITSDPSIAIPEILKILALAPDGTDYKNDHIWINAVDEKIAIRGGSWDASTAGGLFSIHTGLARSVLSGGIGFRSCYYDPNSLISLI